MRVPSRRQQAPSDQGTSGAGGGTAATSRRTYLVTVAIASALLLALFLYGFGGLRPSSQGAGPSSTGTTSYDTVAASVLSSSAGYAPSGYTEGSAKQLNPNEPGILSGAYATFTREGGALANLTVLVFDSQTSAQNYINSVVSNAKTLSGYSNTNSTLSGFSNFGTCYGYAESSPLGGEYVANGVCTKGNVYVQVHLVSASSLQSAELDASGFVGSVYRELA